MHHSLWVGLSCWVAVVSKETPANTVIQQPLSKEKAANSVNLKETIRLTCPKGRTHEAGVSVIDSVTIKISVAWFIHR